LKYLCRIALGGIRQGCLHRLNHLLDQNPILGR
jgi:hypothetical protein